MFKNPKFYKFVEKYKKNKIMDSIKNILFLDIETVPNCSEFDLLNEQEKVLWQKKSQQLRYYKDNNPEDDQNYNYERAGIYAEFGKIICISVGYYANDQFRIKSFAGHDEKVILTDFAALLNNYFNKSNTQLCAHNGKEFDFPYISRRMIIHKIKLPRVLDNSGKKPWEVNHLDTMEMWKFGDYKNYTSLELLAYIMNIPTPKSDIDGSMVADVYYKEKNLERIVNYCNQDVLTVARIYCYMKNLGYIADQDVVVV